MCLTSIQVLSHLDPGPKILVSPPYMYCLNPIQVHIVTSHLPSDSVSTPSKSRYSCVTSIQVTAHLHPGLKMYGTPLSMPLSSRNLHLSSIQVLSQSHPGLNMRLTSIQALSQIYPSYRTLVSPPSKYRLTSIQVPIFMSHLPPGANIYVSHLTTP